MIRDLLRIGGPFSLGLLLVTVLLLRCSLFDLALNEPLPVVDAVAVDEPAPPSAPGVLRNPHAIIVLDVSGSMRRADPDLLQGTAVLQFFEVFQALTREVIESGDSARLALILYSTTAGVVDWGTFPGTGTDTFWLPVTEEAITYLQAAVENHLGEVGNDLRRGWDTDHLAAIQAAIDLAEPLSSPPIVVFMTDGEADPHPLFSPFVPGSAAQELAKAFGPDVVEAVAELRAAGRAPLRSAHRAELLNTRALGVSELAFDEGELGRYLESVRDALDRLESLRMGLAGGMVGCPRWVPVFLEGAEVLSPESRSHLSSSGTCTAWGVSHGVATAEVGGALVREFTRALVPWLGLIEQAWPQPGSRSLSIPVGTRAAAVILRTEGRVDSLAMHSGSRRVRLSGRGDYWAGVLLDPAGDWSLSESSVREGSVFIRPRHAWTLAVPKRVLLSDVQSTIPIEMRLFSFGPPDHDALSEIYRHLPPVLIGEAQWIQEDGAGEGRSLIRFERTEESAFRRGGTAYAGYLMGGEVGSGEIVVAVDLSELYDTGVPLSSNLLSGTVEAVPFYRVVVRDGQSRTVRLHMQVPREAMGVRSMLRR